MAMDEAMTLLEALGRSIGAALVTDRVAIAPAVRQTVSRLPRLELTTTPTLSGTTVAPVVSSSPASAKARSGTLRPSATTSSSTAGGLAGAGLAAPARTVRSSSTLYGGVCPARCSPL